MKRPVRRVAVALGSNLGDRASHLAFAADELRLVLQNVVVSTLMETPPEDGTPQPLFLNGALVGLTSEGPQRLLAILLDIEQRENFDSVFKEVEASLGAIRIYVWNAALNIQQPIFEEVALQLLEPQVFSF